MAQDGNSFILAQASSRPVVPLEGLGEGLTMREERSKAMLVKSPVCISMKRSSEPPEVMTTRLAWSAEPDTPSRGRRYRSEGDEKKGRKFGKRVFFRLSDPGSTSTQAIEENGPRHLRSSRKTRLVPTEQQVCELFTSDDDIDEDSGSSFSGPLGQMYPKGRIRRRRRHGEDEWQKCMQANKNWHASAENSGEASAGIQPSQASDIMS